MTEVLFSLSFLAAAPFWALMIVAPTWRVTTRIINSPLIVVPSLLVCLILVLPLFPDFWALVIAPDLAALQQYVARPEALAGLWAQVIAWDLMVGRWMYLDSRNRGLSPWVMGPVLFLTVLLSPFVLPVYLVLRLMVRSRQHNRAAFDRDLPGRQRIGRRSVSYRPI